ncbi:PREDICTED: proteoglycan 4-like isoform X2 [Dinoponera quadriceps]|uniref:Proteoglycan 4-like isoform X2 n=1 Tax=Dinoponera quadriceps TaxID=609295 RepID=A0A6P3WXF7_DINQU|nr:PREDICTED: proteoglycan 4-like isoform X2 [Dinoponera quadriceps]
MEQPDTTQIQVLKSEGLTTDVDVQSIHVTEIVIDEDTKTAAAAATEDGRDSSVVCEPQPQAILSADNVHSNVESKSEDSADVSNSEVLSGDVHNDATDNLKHDSVQQKPEAYVLEEEPIEVYEHIKDEVNNSTYELESLSNEEDQSLNVITESKVVKEEKKDAIHVADISGDSNVVEDANQSEVVDKRCPELDKPVSEHSETQISDESAGETIKELHENDSNQNSSIVTNAELTKLVNDETEIVVVLEETIPDVDAATDSFVIDLCDKDAGKECNQKTTGVPQEKKSPELGDSIDRGQESDDSAIIEVIATEPVRSSEECAAASDKCDKENAKVTENEAATDGSTKGEESGRSLTNSLSKKDDAPVLGTVLVIDEEITITEDVGPPAPSAPRLENERTPSTESKEADSTRKRSVIQDIFDDWGVENTDEDAQSSSKEHDSVEIELKSLLDEAKPEQPPSKPPQAALEETAASEKSVTRKPAGQTENQKKSKTAANPDAPSLNEKDSPRGSRAFNATLQHTAKNRSRHLTSQVASSAEVTEVLKERFREKQKVVDAPRSPDIFFVKKLTQRLSSKLAGNPIPSLPQQPAPPSSTPAPPTVENCDRNATTIKDGNSDNKELLAILEGDVDPDWAILKPPTLTEESKAPTSNVEHSDYTVGPPKLDPLVEREMALKQLLELPVSSSKKTGTRKKKTFKPAPGRASKDAAEAKSPLAQGAKNARANEERTEQIDLEPARERSNSPKEQDVGQAARAEESRSGRKRKLTEKAREHEQQTTMKRQKVYKGKVALRKQDGNVASDEGSANEAQAEADGALEMPSVDAKEPDGERFDGKAAEPTLSKPENSPLRRPKQSLAKKGSQPITKRKVVVKKLLRQKITPNKKQVKLKAKLSPPSPKKTPSPKVIPKSQKRTASESASSDAKPKKKNINEIDRLLQDEGVVNLLYDVEQPDKKKRLVPITKSRAKVMDLQKVQRELKIRKKLVRNAVLRLRTSSGSVTKVSPRSKRTAQPSDAADKKSTAEQLTSPKAPNAASPTEFILPAKIRNAAEASIIVRRHSSSSFSSASGSPRVSVDTPDKPAGEAAKSTDDGAVHSLRSSAKRRHSQDEKVSVKKSKKKAEKPDAVDAGVTATAAASVTASTTTATASTTTANSAEEKGAVAAVRPSKKSEIKKVASKQQEHIPPVENSVTSSKVTTRSNGAATGKVTAKSKRAVKSKVSFVKPSEAESPEDSSKEEAELSACLAEAATALAIVNAGRSGNNANTRKSKGNTKTEAPGQFRNKEINVRRHGNLVQLILTPSSSTRVRNALTLQVMQEFREALSILNRDDKCRVVLLTSTGTSFCEGLELSTLLRSNKEERRTVTQELAHAVKDFIKSLATFNKPIVAGVQGAAIGLGVTMLPLFDLVIASDKATFCTPYAKLGQIAEGAAVYTLSHILGSPVTSELLLGGRTLTASEALRAGLVTRVLWPDRFQAELVPSLRAMGEQSSQSMEATKALLRHSLRKKLDAALESETYLLIQQWCSAECQTAIKAYIDGKIQ